MLEYGKEKAQKQRLAILRAIAEATKRGGCVIVGKETPDGVRLLVLGKPLVQSQADDIVKKAGF